MQQDELFTELDDRSERELEWIYNPSAPATEKELRQFFSEMRELFTEGGQS